MIFAPINSGKTTMIQNKLLTETDKNFLRFIHFNVSLKDHIHDFQYRIEKNLEKKSEGCFISPGNKLTYIFIDDVNMCKHEPNFGFKNPLEITREWVNFGGWYSKKNSVFNKVEGISFICSFSYNKYINNIKANGLSERNLSNFFLAFMDDLKSNDYISILKSHFISQVSPNPVSSLKEHIASLLIYRLFRRKIIYHEKIFFTKRAFKICKFQLKKCMQYGKFYEMFPRRPSNEIRKTN